MKLLQLITPLSRSFLRS